MGSEGEGAYSLTNLSLALDPGLEGWKLTQEKKVLSMLIVMENSVKISDKFKNDIKSQERVITLPYYLVFPNNQCRDICCQKFKSMALSYDGTPHDG